MPTAAARRPVSPQQARLQALERRYPGSLYRSRCLIRIDRPVSHETLRAAVAAQVEVLDILRTSIVDSGSEGAWQRVDPAPRHGFAVVDLRSAGEARARSELADRLRPHGAGDGNSGRLLALQVRLPGERQRLILALPAVLGDGRSVARLARSIEHSCAGGAPDAENALQ